MVYKSVSIENVIGRVLRNTKLSDMSAMMDMYEWIPEAMELLETQFQLYPEHKDLTVKFHQALLPCGLVILDAVEYKGKRLMFSDQIRQTSKSPISADAFNTVFFKGENPVTGNTFLTSTLEQVRELPLDRSNYYYTKLNYICTSMKDAAVRIYYRIPPLDSNGFPLIPDNGNYKEALYWYVRGKLIGSGQLNDPRQTEDSCMLQFERYGARAVGEITYPSIDRMERIRANQVQFIIPEHYWSNFNAV